LGCSERDGTTTLAYATNNNPPPPRKPSKSIPRCLSATSCIFNWRDLGSIEVPLGEGRPDSAPAHRPVRRGGTPVPRGCFFPVRESVAHVCARGEAARALESTRNGAMPLPRPGQWATWLWRSATLCCAALSASRVRAVRRNRLVVFLFGCHNRNVDTCQLSTIRSSCHTRASCRTHGDFWYHTVWISRIQSHGIRCLIRRRKPVETCRRARCVTCKSSQRVNLGF
jgi:hypothetical protein